MSRKNSKSGYSNVENREMHKAMVGLRSSSAASPHTLKKNKGTRSSKKMKAIKDFY